MKNYTPGPWKIDILVSGSQKAFRISGGGFPEGSPRANARLIAAAPDLLEAAKVMIEAYTPSHENEWQYEDGWGKSHRRSYGKDQKVRQDLIKAIAKAEEENDEETKTIRNDLP